MVRWQGASDFGMAKRYVEWIKAPVNTECREPVRSVQLGISWGSDWLESLVTDDVQSLPHPAENEPVVYWRPGCGFCSMLRAGLQRHGISFREVNIWDDPDAAAFVRSVARGNETVPTVTVGSVSLVNPSVDEIAELLASADS